MSSKTFSFTFFAVLLVLVSACFGYTTTETLEPGKYEVLGPFPAGCDVYYNLSVNNSTNTTSPTMNLYVTTEDFVSYAPANYNQNCSCLDTYVCEDSCISAEGEDTYIVISSNTLVQSVSYDLTYAACGNYLVTFIILVIVVLCCCCCCCVGGCALIGVFFCGCGAVLGCATRNTGSDAGEHTYDDVSYA